MGMLQEQGLFSNDKQLLDPAFTDCDLVVIVQHLCVTLTGDVVL